MVGRNRNVAKVRLMDPHGTVMDGVYFGEADEFVRLSKTGHLFLLLIIRKSISSEEEKIFRLSFRIIASAVFFKGLIL